MGRVASFLANSKAAAATEFALIAPFLVFLLVAGFDFSRYVVGAEHAQAVSYSIAQMLSQTSPNNAAVDNGDGVVTDATLQWYLNSAMVTFPEVLYESYVLQTPWTSVISVNATSLRFKATVASCTSNCTYTPSVIWTTGNRPCNTQFSAVSDTSAPSATTLPADLYGPNSQLVVDVVYNFTPILGGTWLGPMSIHRTTYMSPRNANMIETSSSSTIARVCAGVL